MVIQKLRSIQKPYFGYEEISRALGITLASAKVSASRYVRQGLLVRLKRNLYLLSERWNNATRLEKYMLANLIQVPSYVSLMTALEYYEITTQMQQNFFESIGQKRTKEISVDDTVFRYTKIRKSLYFGFTRQKHIFMASPEKALLDAIYLMTLGRYALDLTTIDSDKINKRELMQLSRRFPQRTRDTLKKYGYIAAT